MRISHLSDDDFETSGLKAVRSEREAISVVLQHFNEAERRRIYSKHKLDSLFAYATKIWGYSEDEAARRISAMRLMREIPAIEEKIQTGALTLSHLNKAQTMFRREKKAKKPRAVQSKLEILAKIEKMPLRKVDQTLELETFEPQPRKSSEPVKLGQFSEKVREKLARLLDVRSHTLDRGDLENLIDQMSDLALAKWDPMEKARRAIERSEKRSEALDDVSTSKFDAPLPATSRVETEGLVAMKRTYICAATRHFVRLRDGGRCKTCGSTHATQVDHIIPPSRGGTNEPSNLRLLCRSCNLRRAVEIYGVKKMSLYLKEPHSSYVDSGIRGSAGATSRLPRRCLGQNRRERYRASRARREARRIS